MGEVAHEIIGAKLVFGIEAVFFQVSRPLGELRPPGGDEFSVSLGVRDGVAENEHVAALFDRHSFAAIVAAEDQRIGAQVVRGVGKLPVRRGGVHQHGDQRGLGQRRG